MLRSGHATRVEEWHDPEPAADDDPRSRAGRWARRNRRTRRGAAARTGPVPGALAVPAGREALLTALAGNHAPEPLSDLVRTLPKDATYRSAREVVDALGERAG
ncbi:DUF2795 domain-containing protein [Streptomyces sp. M19]